MILLLSALLLASPLQDAPTITAELLPPTARVGEAVVLRVSVALRGTAAPRIDQPAFHSSLHVVGTQDFSETGFGLNTRTTTTRREFILLPQAQGSFDIPSVRVTIGRRVYRTRSLSLKVANAVTEPERVTDDSEARVVVHMEPETVYVGQQSTLVGEVMLTSDLQMRLTRPPSYDAPAPADFWIQELPADGTTDVRLIDNRRFIVQRFFRAYFPLTPGNYSFAPARVTYEARQGFLFAPQTRELRSESPHVTVLPIPDQGRPQAFHGAVGALSMTAKLEPRNSAVGDAVTLTVELRGRGNVKALPAPQLPAMPGFEVLDPSEVAEFDSRARELSGFKRFAWVLVPEREGQFNLPTIEYASFDPELRTFRTHVVDPGGVSVQPAGMATPPTAARLRPQPEPDPLGWVHSPLFLAAQLVPITFVALGLLMSRRRSGPAPNIKRAWDQRLMALRAARSNPLTHAEKLLRDVLATVAPGSRVRSGSPSELQRELAGAVSLEFAERAARVLERLENARYAPGEVDPDERKQILDELGEVLDRAWKHLRSVAYAQPALLPLVFIAWQAAAPAQAFDAGSAAYRERDLGVAIQEFNRYVNSQPNDPAGWYNLGMAFEADRKPARAAWALLHTIELRPRAADVHSHLSRLGAQRLAERVRPVLRINTAETWLMASGFWWLGAAIVGVALVLRRRRLIRAALPPLFLSGLVLLTWGVERALPRPAIVLDQGAPLLAGRSLHADVVRHLQPLSAVTVLEEAEGWTRVRTPTGESGWVSFDGIGKL